MVDPDDRGKQSNPLWRAVFSGEDARLRWGRQMFRVMSPTARERCRLCYAGFDGFSAPLMRAMGRSPWLRNPHYCQKCESVLAEQRSGAEIEMPSSMPMCAARPSWRRGSGRRLSPT
jgi:hypothetical protein